jgi:hypothetical protein
MQRKTNEHWKSFINLKKCSFCNSVAAHYHRFKFYCKECYKKLIKEGKK